MNRLALTAIALIVSASGVALADEHPQIAAAGDTTVAAGPVYLRAGVSFQSIDLPSVDLGEKRLAFDSLGGNSNAGPVATFKPRATGAGFDGGVGYFLPPGFLPPAFGARPRIELDGSYLKANDTESSATTLFPPGTFSFQHVNGVLSFFLICGTDPCPTTSRLRSQYEAWHASAKAASDFAMGPLTMTPSLALFGGESRNEQELFQSTTFVTLPAAAPRTLFETASENATDRFGSRLGLNGKYDVTPWLALGLGGNVGLAYRHIGLRAYDNSSGSGNKDSFSSGTNVAAFVAGAEASVIARVDPAIAFKLFGGVTYDNNVPGITAQNYTGELFFNNPVTPVSIKTAGEIGYYAGAAVMMRFGQ